MDRYRINYVFLAVMVAGCLVCAGLVYFLREVQVTRNAGEVLGRAERAYEEGNVRDAIMWYSRYRRIVPEDRDALFKLISSYTDLLEEEGIRQEEIPGILGFFESTLQTDPGTDQQFAGRLDEFRRELIGIYMSTRFRRDAQALNHLQVLMRSNPDDPELLALRTRCLVRTGDFNAAIDESYELIGYDPDTDSFDVENAKAAGEADVYRNLASVLRSQRNRPELADRVMDQLVTANPDAHEAYLYRSQYYRSLAEVEKASADVRRAYELNPEDADVIVSFAEQLKSEELYDEAEEAAERGKSLYSDDERFYRTLSDIEFQRGNNDAALAYVEEGLQAVEGRNQVLLLINKANLQIRVGDLEAVAETMARMRELGFRREYVEHVEARLKLVQGEWYNAAQILRRIRPILARNPRMHAEVAFQLAVAHEQLGERELALEAYEMVLRGAPEDLGSDIGQRYQMAVQGKDRMLALLNRTPQAPSESTDLQNVIRQEMAKPEEVRDWSLVSQSLEQYAEANELPELQRTLMRANLLMQQGNFAECRRLLMKAFAEDRDNLAIHRLALQVTAMDPAQGPAAALSMLEQSVKQRFGDLPLLRLTKADLLIAIGGENLEQELMQLTEGMDAYTTDQQVAMWHELARRMLASGMRERALECWTKVTELKPNDLNTRMMLFSLAYDANDDAAMAAAQKRILQIVGTSNDSNWLYTEARRLLSLYRRQRIGEDALREAARLIDAAAAERPDWYDLHVVRAEIAMLKGDRAAALRHYQNAAQLGSPPPSALAQHAQLLVQRGEFAAAGRLIERIPAQVRQRLLGGLYAEILYQTGEVEESLRVAREIVETSPDAPGTQLWYGKFLARASRTGQSGDAAGVAADYLTISDGVGTADQVAGNALRRAVELSPQSPEAWMELIIHHINHGDQAAAEAAIQEMQLSITSEYLPLLLAKCYERLGRGGEAENMYLAAHRSRVDSVPTARQLAEFYLGNGRESPDSEAKARRYLNEILRAGAEGEISASDGNLLWARRRAAQMLSATNEYEDLLKAKNLIASNAQDGQLSLEDRLLTAQILANHPVPESRRIAVRLLEEVKRSGRLNLAADLELGRLYYGLGDWDTARTQMLQVIDRFPNEIAPRATYINMLLERGEAGNRTKIHVDKLRELQPQHPDTVSLYVRYLKALDREQEAQQYLKGSLLPPESDWANANDQQLPVFQRIADLLVEANDLQTAEKIYSFLMQRNPLMTFRLAEHIGLHGDVARSFALLDQVHRIELTPRTVRSALHILRQRRDEVGSQFDPRVDAWFGEGLREDPESMALLIQKAEFRDLQGKYDEAIDIYLSLLSRHDLDGVLRAVVLNNVSYLIALADSQEQYGVDPLQLVEEAIQIWGPRADILDTKAVVLISRQQYQQALEDLELSVTDGPSSSKYFHKAVAHLLAGQNSRAIQAWEKAVELGLTRESVNQMERDRYDEIKSKIERLQSQSSNLTRSRPAASQTQGGALATAGN